MFAGKSAISSIARHAAAREQSPGSIVPSPKDFKHARGADHQVQTGKDWERNGRGRIGFEAMAKAYVQFAAAHPSHYRVMFGGFIESAAKDDDFVAEAKAAFQVLVDALVELQTVSDIRRDDPVLMARFSWALVHGTAMLVIDGQLPEAAQREALEQYSAERIYASIRQETVLSE